MFSRSLSHTSRIAKVPSKIYLQCFTRILSLSNVQFLLHIWTVASILVLFVRRTNWWFSSLCLYPLKVFRPLRVCFNRKQKAHILLFLLSMKPQRTKYTTLVGYRLGFCQSLRGLSTLSSTSDDEVTPSNGQLEDRI